MDAPHRPAPTAAPAVGYDRAGLEQFFAACAEERARLQRETDDARVRIARARAALDSRRVLSVMLESAVDEITAKRRQADIVVGRIVAPATAPHAAAGAPAAVPAHLVADRTASPIVWQSTADSLVPHGGSS